MPSTKHEGLSYHIHFLKSRVGVIRNNFPYKSIFLRDEMFFFYISFDTNKAKYILNMHISCSPVVTQLIVKV